ncbi:hypothetical protein V9K97_13695 [Variovorax sp. CCNWLW186]|uniref:hypothetical protein n=1 Tax=Variovorax sp. CCNWLW186 TaxID=3127473 RepID=UPI003076A8BF
MKINAGECFHSLIRNEKVGCSIHLSGTKKVKARYPKGSGLFYFSLRCSHRTSKAWHNARPSCFTDQNKGLHVGCGAGDA